MAALRNRESVFCTVRAEKFKQEVVKRAFLKGIDRFS
jgi:hypothetical protein